MTDKEQAIAYANEHRSIHVEWVEYFEYWIEHGEPWDKLATPLGHVENCLDVNDLPKAQAHHEESIERYDLIIKVLSHSEDWSE